MGAFRTLENGRPVDSAVAVKQRASFDGAYADSNRLASALAESESVRECFARFMFRAGAATVGPSRARAETEFVESWRSTPAAAQGNILETLIAFVTRPTFAQRRLQ